MRIYVLASRAAQSAWHTVERSPLMQILMSESSPILPLSHFDYGLLAPCIGTLLSESESDTIFIDLYRMTRSAHVALQIGKWITRIPNLDMLFVEYFPLLAWRWGRWRLKKRTTPRCLVDILSHIPQFSLPSISIAFSRFPPWNWSMHRSK